MEKFKTLLWWINNVIIKVVSLHRFEDKHNVSGAKSHNLHEKMSQIVIDYAISHKENEELRSFLKNMFMCLS